VSNLKLSLTLVILGVLVIAKPVLGESFTIVTPYYGIEDNTMEYGKYGVELEDSAPMKGLYLQNVNPDKFQWNLFLYRTEHINYSDLWGFNFIYDYYFGTHDNIKNVIGLGMNYLDNNLMGEDVPTKFGKLPAMQMDFSVTSYYLRIGRYYDFGNDQLHCSVLPWAGWEWDRTDGEGFVAISPRYSVKFPMDDEQSTLLVGLNFKMTFHHFLQAELKHSVVCDHDDYLNRSSAMVNLFFTKNIGLSYRYNRQELAMGTDEHSMLGIAVVF
jgi:hypothetical protein